MSRILHLSDTHIDRFLGRQSRLDDITAALAEVVAIAKEHRPDLVIHSGDLFQSPRPSIEGMGLAFDFLREISAIAPIVVVCGNHDSPPLFDVFDKVLGDRIHLISRARRPDDGGLLFFPGAHEEMLRLAPLPFIHANRVASQVISDNPDTWMAGYADYVGQVERMLEQGLQRDFQVDRDILLFAAHLHVAGAKFSGSEKPMHISDVYGSHAQAVPQVNYAALGHIHKPQPLAGTTPGRFAGSIIQMDFGEEGEEKGVVLVDALPGRPADIQVIPLKSGRRLKRLGGTLEQLREIASTITNEIVRVTVTTETHDPALSQRVSELLPASATLIEVIEVCRDRKLTILDATQFKEADRETDFTSLFADFLQHQGSLDAPAKTVMETFSSLLDALDAPSEMELPEIAALGGAHQETNS